MRKNNLLSALEERVTGQHVLLSGLLPALLLTALAMAILAGSALAATTNLVKNGSFEKDGDHDGVPNMWNGVNLTPADKRTCKQSKPGNCSFTMVGDGTNKVLLQDIFISGSALDEFDFSAWTKGKSIVYGAGEVVVYVQINYTDGDSNGWYLYIPVGTSPWTLRQIHVVSPKDYDSIQIFLSIFSDSGKAWVDGVKLIPAP